MVNPKKVLSIPIDKLSNKEWLSLVDIFRTFYFEIDSNSIDKISKSFSFVLNNS